MHDEDGEDEGDEDEGDGDGEGRIELEDHTRQGPRSWRRGRMEADQEEGNAEGEEQKRERERERRKGIEECVGNTPMVRIGSLSRETGCEIWAKVEVSFLFFFALLCFCCAFAFWGDWFDVYSLVSQITCFFFSFLVSICATPPCFSRSLVFRFLILGGVLFESDRIGWGCHAIQCEPIMTTYETEAKWAGRQADR